MTCFDDKLAELQEKISHEGKLNAMVNDLDAQRLELAKKVWELEKYVMSEDADVEKLEEISISSLFLKLLGKMDEKLDKEKAEALAARMKYNTAASELRRIENQITQYKIQLRDIDKIRNEYNKVFKEKSDAIKNMGGGVGEKIMKLEEQYSALESHKKELDEAIVAGNRALMIANQITESLRNAEKWGKWDAYGGGGAMTHAAKYKHIEQAQIDVTRLQYELRTFHAELSDVRISENMYVQIDGFSRFADYFFDGIFVDWSILKKIGNSMDAVNGTKTQIRTALHRLNSMYSVAQQEQSRIKQERDELVNNIAM